MSKDPSGDPIRLGEAGPVPPRSNRTFEKADGWYFMTRERVDVGPFATQTLAEQGVQDYAGFSMDADKVYLDSLDSVPDESGLSDRIDVDEGMPAPPADEPELFDRRRGDEEPAVVRSRRVVLRHGGWYFATREGGHVGPFPTQADAERGVADYVSFSIDLESATGEDS